VSSFSRKPAQNRGLATRAGARHVPPVPADPLLTLREYRRLAPWNVRDLAATAAALLAGSRVRPVSASAAVAPAERTVRFYVTRGLLSPPEGRGTAAIYSYRHLLQLLAIKLRQMEGAPLATIGREFQDATGDVLERRVAAALGEHLPRPEALAVAGAGRAFQTSLTAPSVDQGGERWRRVPVTAGVELHLREGHPLSGLEADHVARTVRNALDLLGKTSGAA
jgi:DNA-binding transcriptional MerR regulator